MAQIDLSCLVVCLPGVKVSVGMLNTMLDVKELVQRDLIDRPRGVSAGERTLAEI